MRILLRQNVLRLFAGTTLAVVALSSAPALAESSMGAAKPWSAMTGQQGSQLAATVDIVDTAVAAGTFKTLVAALKAAGLVDTLKGSGPFTVFAPTDQAFAKLPAGTVENLLKPENKAKLVSILTYHVVSGNVMSGDLAGKTFAVATVEGAKVNINATGSAVKVNEATVTKADIGAKNGVIHVIDTVILPPQS